MAARGCVAMASISGGFPRRAGRGGAARLGPGCYHQTNQSSKRAEMSRSGDDQCYCSPYTRAPAANSAELASSPPPSPPQPQGYEFFFFARRDPRHGCPVLEGNAVNVLL